MITIFELRILNYELRITNYALSIVNCPLSIVNFSDAARTPCVQDFPTTNGLSEYPRPL